MKSIVLNFCQGLKEPEKELFYFPLYEIGLISFIHADNSPHIICSRISQELDTIGLNEWQLICVFQEGFLTDTKVNVKSIRKIFRFVQDEIIDSLLSKPARTSFVYLTESQYLSSKSEDLDGDIFMGNKLELVCNTIKGLWKVVTDFDTNNIVINNRFEGINNSDFKDLIKVNSEKILESFKVGLLDTFDNEQYKISSKCYAVRKSDTDDLFKLFESIIESGKDKPDSYNAFKPDIELRKLVKDTFGILAPQFNNYQLFVIKTGNQSLDNEVKKAHLNLFILLGFLCENNMMGAHTSFKNAVQFDMDSEKFKQCLSAYYFAMDNGIKEFQQEKENRKVELKLYSENIDFRSEEDPPLTETTPPDFGFYYNTSHYNDWLTYLELETKNLKQFKKNIQEQISEMFLSAKMASTETLNKTIDDIFEEEKSTKMKIENLEKNMTFPETPDVFDEWNSFKESVNPFMQMYLSRLPRKKNVILSVGTGLLVLCISLFFHNNLFWVLWLVVYISASIGIALLTQYYLKKPVLLTVLHAKTKISALYNVLQKGKNDYCNYMSQIMLIRIIRHNYSILRKAVDEKNQTAMKYGYHTNVMKRCNHKAKALLDLLGAVPDESKSSSPIQKADVNKPENQNCIYNILNREYTGDALPVTINDVEIQSVYGGLIKEIKITDI